MKFRISTGLKNIIGRELITNDLIAVFELVKNSYDAKAKVVRIIFRDTKKGPKKAKIIIVDTGNGMSLEDLKDKWLFVAYSEKKDFEKNLAEKGEDFRDKVQDGRFFAGAKGIGRFSCDRLGSELKLYTKKKNENVIHSLYVNWKDFEQNQEKEFQKIDAEYSDNNKIDPEEYGLKDFKKGTILEISSLNEDWDWKKLSDLKKYLQRLINPSQVDARDDFQIDLEAKEYLDDDEIHKTEGEYGFKVINGPVKNIVFEKLNIKTTRVSCDIDEHGKIISMQLSDKGTPIFSIEEKNIYPLLKNITVKVFFLNTEAKRAFTKIMGIQPVNYGSIFLYKNKFRIHPYGDEGDDWLGLEVRRGQGWMRFLSGRELIGRIEIIGPQKAFTEVSSRGGGVIETKEFLELKEFFINKVLKRIEKYVVEGIDWDKELANPEDIQKNTIKVIEKIAGEAEDAKITFNKNFLDIYQQKEPDKIPDLMKNLEGLKDYVSKPEDKEYIENQVSLLKRHMKNLQDDNKMAEEAIDELEEDLDVKEKESLFLKKSLSSDKDMLINLQHSVKGYSDLIEIYIKDINDEIGSRKLNDTIINLIDQIAIENSKINMISSFVTVANFNTKVERIEKDLVQYIQDYLKDFVTVKKKSLDIRFKNADIQFITTFKPLEISLIFDNMISNSKKAGASAMVVAFDIVDKKLRIRVSDNGKGVEEKATRYLFTRGFTTTNGSGLGLHYILTIVQSMHGVINFAGNNFKGLERGACFELIFKRQGAK